MHGATWQTISINVITARCPTSADGRGAHIFKNRQGGQNCGNLKDNIKQHTYERVTNMTTTHNKSANTLPCALEATARDTPEGSVEDTQKTTRPRETRTDQTATYRTEQECPNKNDRQIITYRGHQKPTTSILSTRTTSRHKYQHSKGCESKSRHDCPHHNSQQINEATTNGSKRRSRVFVTTPDTVHLYKI